MRLFFVLGSISSFLMVCYYILNIYLFINFSNKNIVASKPSNGEASCKAASRELASLLQLYSCSEAAVTAAAKLLQDRLNYLPKFIQDWVKFIEEMSKYEDKGYYIEFYLRLIIVYLLVFLMCSVAAVVASLLLPLL